MKELTRLVLKSGLIDKHAEILMERWGCLDPGLSYSPSVYIIDENTTLESKKQIQQALTNFIEELELLLQPEAIERSETTLDTTKE